MIFTDTHTHLYLEEFAQDIEQVVQNSLNKNVNYMFLPNIDTGSINDMLKLCSRYPSHIFPMMGLHPTSVDANYHQQLEVMYGYLKNSSTNFVAIGEIGIDLYWDKTYATEQEKALRIQLQWAKEFNLPVVLHTRNSFRETMDILKSEYNQDLKGVFHCFGGSYDEAQEIIDLGFKMGIGGVSTFKNSGLDKLLPQIDLKHIVLETDAPYLAPVPYRGTRNESSYIIHIAQKITDIKNIELEEVAEVTTRNALELFRIKQ